MGEELHGDEGYVPEQEREAAEEAASDDAGAEAEEAERALAEASADSEVLPPTDEETVDEDEEAGYEEGS